MESKCRYDPSNVSAERRRRFAIWAELVARYPGGIAVPPSFVRKLRIYGGMGQGVFIDKKRVTGAIIENGVAVGLNWANGYTEDRLGVEGLSPFLNPLTIVGLVQM